MINQIYLIVEGKQDLHPNYEDATVRLSVSDPTVIRPENCFVCSPLFSLKGEVSSLPVLADIKAIYFLLTPSPFPTFSKLLKGYSAAGNQMWFSLGLANLVIFDTGGSVASKMLEFLNSNYVVYGIEKWTLSNARIDNYMVCGEPINVQRIESPSLCRLPLSIRMVVSEFLTTAEQVLTAAKRFTPYYYLPFRDILEQSLLLVDDLCYLHGGSANPTLFVRDNLMADVDPVKLVNDRLGHLIQLSSGLSYVYSQSFAGTLPVLQHRGIVRRHSLLGIGSAVGALFELVSQLEDGFRYAPFGDMIVELYSQVQVPDSYGLSPPPEEHLVSVWKNDVKRYQMIMDCSPETAPDDFFGRFAFFSGRLGFREYGFSATAALQSLVAGATLEWNVINYTHEIIHNHVRFILEELIVPEERLDRGESWLSEQLNIMDNIMEGRSATTLNYSDYIRYILFRYCVISNYYGSLSERWRVEKFIDYDQALPQRKFRLPNTAELDQAIRNSYRDISEIFVHVIDFVYIYKRDVNIYLNSIWTSWETEPVVWSDIGQYVLRTLLVIGCSYEGTPSYRYNESLKDLQRFASGKGAIRTRIEEYLDKPDSSEDLKYRFYNCILVADCANLFFVGRLEKHFNKDDQNVVPRGQKHYYNISIGEFDDLQIASKVRFLLENVRWICENPSCGVSERSTAWLFLGLSSVET